MEEVYERYTGDNNPCLFIDDNITSLKLKLLIPFYFVVWSN